MSANVTLPGSGAVISTDDIAGVEIQRVKIVTGAATVDGGVVTPSNPLSISFGPVTVTNKSGSITTGGTAQNAAASNANRRGFWLQNNSAGDLWINTLATAIAGQPSLLIPSGAYYECPVGGCDGGAISVFGATTGQTFSAREW